jgi:5'-nucleotidase / UDP-sugar diphosphatase
MGRETKILLALLATLAGVFLGVLSMKLLVPRPPVGAGPDVHIDVATAESHELVEPPSLSPTVLVPTATEPSVDEAGPPPPSRYAEREFTPDSGDLLPPPMPADAPSGTPPANMPQTAARHEERPLSPPAAPDIPAAPPRRDPFVAPAGLQMPIMQPPITQAPVAEPVPPAEPMSAAAAAYVTNPGDSWWDLAERAYGDGRLYRALFAWNRVINPRVSLAPGTRLEIPPRTRLEAAWPKLMPAE